ncbi:MAG: PKD domain-containing protein [Opitutus sp.]|nr:PKD domain-containing protein [Opitutus sp.]
MPSPRLRWLIVPLVLAAICFVAQRQVPSGILRPAQIESAARDGGTVASDPAVCAPTGIAPGEKIANALAARAQRADALAKTSAFTAWLTDWHRADSAAQPALAASGLALAVARRGALQHLIETDPQRALELAVPVGLRAELPATVEEQLERRVDQRGDLEVSISHLGAAARVERIARLAGANYRAFVFGRREGQQTKSGLPLHGIAIDDAAALAEMPYRILDDTEKFSRGLPPDQTALWVGSEVTVVASTTELAQLTGRLVAAESAVGPRVLELMSGSPGGALTSTPATAEVTSPPSWINGTKRVLWLKIDFSDDTGAAYTDAEIQAGGAATNDFYVANSQGKTTLAFSILPTVLRMPKDKAYYSASGSTNGELYVAAHDAAKAYDVANGGTGAWDPDKFDRYLIIHRRIFVYLYGGVAQLGGPRVGLNNTVGAGTVGHELGHTQSLAHSHYWLPTGTSPVAAGTHVEYGDVFDIMGGGGNTQQFNVSQKFKLGYLDNTSVTTVAQAGTYRVFRHDDKDAAGIRGLRISPGDLGYEYWVEHRRAAPTAFNAAQLDRFRNGVLIHWGAEKSPKFTTGQGTYLLDATPGSAGGASDAPVRTGETFVDPDAGITIKPLAAGGTAPNEYIDVQVAFGATDGNRNPVLVADAPAGLIAARTNVVFNASGSDPDGDSLYYRWDFGDGSLQPNLGSITRRFVKGGPYSLRVSAHDGKGGIAVKTIALNVADPLVSWTSRSSGVTNVLYGAIFAGGKFVVVGDNGAALTSADGATWARSATPITSHFYRGIAHNGARYATVGVGAANAAIRATAAFSTDGLGWTAATVPAGAGNMLAAAHGAGRFVAVGETGRIYNSTDGAVWSEVTSPVTTSLGAVAYADNLFVATGASGRVLTSTDGATWINRSVATGNTLGAVARHQNVWYASSATAECFTSPDGIVWTRVSTSGRANNTQRMISASGVLLTTTANGGIAFTEDPRSWATHQIDATANTTINGVAEGNGAIVVVGSRGIIFSTATSQASPVLPAPTLRIEADAIKVAVGKKNVLAASGAGFVKLELYANGTKVSEVNGSAGALAWTPATIGNYLLTVRGIDASGASVVSAAYPAFAGFTNWKWRNPTPTGAELRGAVRVDDKWWIVGGGGTLITLDDAGNFNPINFSTTQQLNAIAYANGRFVIATTDLDGATKEDIGGLWTSPDGYSWTPFLTGALDSANLNTAIYAADRWIGLGTGGTIVTSTDGINWPRSASGITQSITSVAFGNGLIVAVATGGQIVTSPNGQTWTPRTSGVTADLRGLTFANGTFVAVGSGGAILTSANGTTWTRATSGTTTNLYGVAFVKGAFVVGGDAGTVLASANGATWTAASLGGNTSGTFFIAGSGDEGLLVGRAGEVYAPTTAALWRRMTRGTGESMFSVIYAGGRFVAVGQTTDAITRVIGVPISVSTDGITWTRAATATGFTNVNDVGFARDLYVTVGETGRIFTSGNATTWTQRTSGVTTQLNAIAGCPSGFVAGGAGGAILSSPDGTTWTSRTSGTTQPLRAATYGAGRHVMVGDNGAIVQSTDGVTWAAASSGVPAALLTIGWWEEVGFIAAGNGGTMLSSVDGITWLQRETGVAENIAAIAKTPVGYVAAGGTQGTLLVSLDGISWSLSALPADKTIRGLAASPNAIVAVGDSGAMLTFEIVDTTPAPVIVAQPVSRPGVAGDTVTFSISAQNAAGAVYQWFKDGAVIIGANSPVYTIPLVTTAHAGAYTISVSTPTGTSTSAAANLSFGAVADPGRLVNLSILTALTSAADSFTFGVVVGGAGTSGGKALLVRAAGPSLTALGVTGVLDDPKLEFFTGSAKVGENDNWGGSAAITAAMSQVGAFPFSSPTSRDAAISLPSLASGANSAKITGTGVGTVIAELYDATASSAFTATTPRLVNVSVLKHLGSGVTAGFVIGGSSARTVLIRAIGPTLGGFGVGDVVADPQLALFSGATQIGANDNWGGTAALAAAFDNVGAFQLAGGSKDAALLVTLQPGNYTVQVSGVGGTTGVALVEVYEVP